jgi:hypothetical protein
MRQITSFLNEFYGSQFFFSGNQTNLHKNPLAAQQSQICSTVSTGTLGKFTSMINFNSLQRFAVQKGAKWEF